MACLISTASASIGRPRVLAAKIAMHTGKQCYKRQELPGTQTARSGAEKHTRHGHREQLQAQEFVVPGLALQAQAFVFPCLAQACPEAAALPLLLRLRTLASFRFVKKRFFDLRHKMSSHRSARSLGVVAALVATAAVTVYRQQQSAG